MGAPSRNAIIAGKYELIEEIGRGGMGSVWRAHALALDMSCAIKFLLPELARDSVAHARFVHEARSAARLRSAHAVTIFDVDTWEGLPYIAMEYLSGENLEQRLARDGRLTPALTCEIARQTALGLSKAHALGLVHRDLKPENIFLVDDDALLVKLLDFGVVKTLDAPLELKTVSGTIVGTPHYMSPEQANGADVDGRSDLWSLAVVVYRCLTGRFPFDGPSLPSLLMSVLYQPIPMPTQHNPSLPRQIDAWWARAASRDPAQRWQTATELVHELEFALGQTARGSQPSRLDRQSIVRTPEATDPTQRRSSVTRIAQQLAASDGPRVTLMTLVTAAILLGGAYWFAARSGTLDDASELDAASAVSPPEPELSAGEQPSKGVALNLPTRAKRARDAGGTVTRAPIETKARSSGDERWGF